MANKQTPPNYKVHKLSKKMKPKKYAIPLGAIIFGTLLFNLPTTLNAKAIMADNKTSAEMASTQNLSRKTTPNNQFLSLKSNETIEILGTNFVAKTDCQFVKNTSSEFVTLAVVTGTLTNERKSAKSGEAFIIEVAGNSVQKFNYDAARLLATIDPEWAAQIAPSLEPIIKSQKAKKFWGLLEPTGVNTSAPLPPFIERVRASYLAVPTIMELRRKSRGSANLLQSLTAQKFKEAIATSDIETIAALIDPLPFTDATDNAQVWLEARRNFAIQISQDSAMKATFANGSLSQDPLIGIFFVGPEGAAYRMITVNRDSAVFIAAVEAIKDQEIGTIK